MKRFLSLERSLYSKGQFQKFSTVMEEYFKMNHAELVPVADLQKPPKEIFYLPMHAVRKEHSSTTKLRVVFDASAKSANGISLNDLLLVGLTVHSPLIDVLLRFRLHHVALTADVSKMYRAIELVPSDRDLHRFVWRRTSEEPLQDYCMTRVTFGVSTSSFAANMSLKQNALDFAVDYPQAAKVVEDSFYVDDGLTGADSIQDAIELRKQPPMISLVGSLPQTSRSRYSYSNSGSRKLAGMTPYHNLSWMSGYNGALSYTSSHTSTSLNVMLTRSLKSPQCNSMDSVMPLSEPMGQSSTLE